jgi:phospholipase C
VDASERKREGPIRPDLGWSPDIDLLQIKHVVYLMMENHSFDNIAGYWDFRDDIDNLNNLGQPYCNPYTNPNWTVWGEAIDICAAPYEGEVPYDDPDHDFAGTNYEIFQTYYPTEESVPTMQGFVDRESARYSLTPGESAFVIKAYDQKRTATLAEIAENFAFFDTYVCTPYSPRATLLTGGADD